MFADFDLACRLERTEGFAGASFVGARGGPSKCARIAGCYAMFDGADSPLTQTFALGMPEPVTASVLQQVEDFFHQNGGPAVHEICPLAGISLLQLIAESGYLPLELSNVMFLELPNISKSSPGSLQVRLAGTDDIETYASAAAQGWGMTPEMPRMMFNAEGYTGFLVEKDGLAIATAGLVIHDGVALFAGASTIPSHRGLGAQKAVLDARFEYAASAGCDLAMMVVEPGSTSQHNAERCGFRIAYTRTKWRR